MQPLYPLYEVKRICSEEDVRLDRTRCLDLLTPYIDLFKCKPFAREVVAVLTLDDFAGTVQIGEAHFDQYGVCLPDALKEKYGIQQLGNFYVKFRISRARSRKLIFFISLHELERRIWRRGGPLDPRTQ